MVSLGALGKNHLNQQPRETVPSQGQSPLQAGFAAGRQAVPGVCEGRLLSSSAFLLLLHSLPFLAPGDWDSPLFKP